MAQSKQALRSRIKSVNSTKKITKAMEMIANAKLFKQRNRMEANRVYAERLHEVVNEIVSHNPDVESIFLQKKDIKERMTIVFCSDLGLCGGYNQNVLKQARQSINKADPVILIGTSLYNTMKEEEFNLVNEKPIKSDTLTYAILRDCLEDGIQRYVDHQIGGLQVIYTKFVNTMTFQPMVDELLPFTMHEEKEVEQVHVETLFEPNAQNILKKIIPMMIIDVAYSHWMETTTSEQGSRRVAMKTASDNADELGAELLLEYNKARQAAITQEITEIVGGSNAV